MDNLKHGWRLGRAFGMGALMLGGVLAGMKTGLDIDRGVIALVALGLGVGGLVVGRFLRESRCSEPRCGVPLAPDRTTCPRCGGTIVGVIHHPRERPPPPASPSPPRRPDPKVSRAPAPAAAPPPG